MKLVTQRIPPSEDSRFKENIRKEAAVAGRKLEIKIRQHGTHSAGQTKPTEGKASAVSSPVRFATERDFQSPRKGVARRKIE